MSLDPACCRSPPSLSQAAASLLRAAEDGRLAEASCPEKRNRNKSNTQHRNHLEGLVLPSYAQDSHLVSVYNSKASDGELGSESLGPNQDRHR